MFHSVLPTVNCLHNITTWLLCNLRELRSIKTELMTDPPKTLLQKAGGCHSLIPVTHYMRRLWCCTLCLNFLFYFQAFHLQHSVVLCENHNYIIVLHFSPGFKHAGKAFVMPVPCPGRGVPGLYCLYEGPADWPPTQWHLQTQTWNPLGAEKEKWMRSGKKTAASEEEI